VREKPAPRPAQGLRADARRNLDKLRAAAAEAFSERGLDMPLEEIAARAGVSIGTLYNRLGPRDALVDAVVADPAALVTPGRWESAAQDHQPARPKPPVRRQPTWMTSALHLLHDRCHDSAQIDLFGAWRDS